MDRIPAEPFGRYILYGKLKSGGMAELYFALEPSNSPFELARFVAIKKILPHISANRLFVDQLIQEAKVGVLLEHPNIVEVLDLGSEAGSFFLVMPFIQGKDLLDVLTALNEKKQKLSEPIVLYIGLKLLAALDHAHELKDADGKELLVIHRDVSPGNVLVSYRGEVKLVDFGVALSELHREAEVELLGAGKWFYMSPEQMTGKSVDRRSDLYGAGVLLFELLTGQRPIQASTIVEFREKILSPARPSARELNSSVCEETDAIIRRALHPDPAERFSTAREMADQIDRILTAHHRIDLSRPEDDLKLQRELSAVMRQLFSSVIEREIFLNQEALNDFKLRSDAIRAVPSAELVDSFDRWEGAVSASTQFLPDAANEATRALYLSAGEREKVLQAIRPPEVAVDPGRESFSKWIEQSVRDPVNPNRVLPLSRHFFEIVRRWKLDDLLLGAAVLALIGVALLLALT